MTTGDATRKEAQKDYENCYGSQRTMGKILFFIGGVISIIFFIIGGTVLNKEKDQARSEALLNYSKAFKDNPDKAKDIADEFMGKSVYKKTQARFYAEENPYANPSDMSMWHGVDENEFRKARKDIFSEKNKIYHNDEKNLNDIHSQDNKKD